MTTPRTGARTPSTQPAPGPGERFTGQGVMGLTLSSGHVLALRDVIARTLRSGRVRLHGQVPNGQHFRVHPLHVWRVADSTAALQMGALAS